MSEIPTGIPARTADRRVAAMSAPIPTAGNREALLHCADEPIAVPGAIQPHGALLALDRAGATVVSRVRQRRPGSSAARCWAGRWTSCSPPATSPTCARGWPATSATQSAAAVPSAGPSVDLVLHRPDGLLIAEWEPLAGAEEAGGGLARPAARRPAAAVGHRHAGGAHRRRSPATCGR